MHRFASSAKVKEPPRGEFREDTGAVPSQSEAEVLSVDVETWSVETSCATDTCFLLDLFREHRAKATFFVLATVARREPELVRRIAQEGHEVGSHGWDHDQVYKKTPLQYYEEMARSHELLSNLVGSSILGYRAPHFSIREETAWAFDALVRAGFQYDSSIFPFAGRRYGVPDFSRGPVRIVREGGSILEIPLSTVVLWNRKLPVAGGGYFRLLPYPIIRRAALRVHEDELPFVAYCHPYEFRKERLVFPSEPGPFRAVRAAVMSAKFNLFRQSMRSKLTSLLREFRFTSIQEKFFDATTPNHVGVAALR